MDICIRADGGNNIGMGHIMRTLVLAKEFSKNNKVFYACKIDKLKTNKYIPGINKIKEEGYKVIYLDENNYKEELYKINADCLITDSYDIDEEYFYIVKKNFKISGCLDDENIINYYNVDFLINQNIYANDLSYKVNKNTKMMLGSKYIILRDEFIRETKKIINNDIKKIMVTVGGSDNNNITEKIIKNLINDKDYELHIVVGSGFIHTNNLKKYENNTIKFYFNANMSELMNKCDLAISSCGTTLYELAACKTPTIGIIVAENQNLAAKTMDKEGIILYSEIDKLNENIELMTKEKRNNLSIKSLDLVDGKGRERIVKQIEELFVEGKYK